MSRRPTKTVLGPRFSEGARLLWLALEKHDWSQEDLAKRLGGGESTTQQSVVSRWLYGERRPALGFAIQLEKLLGIAVKTWTMTPKRPFSPPGLRGTGTDG